MGWAPELLHALEAFGPGLVSAGVELFKGCARFRLEFTLEVCVTAVMHPPPSPACPTTAADLACTICSDVPLMPARWAAVAGHYRSCQPMMEINSCSPPCGN